MKLRHWAGALGVLVVASLVPTGSAGAASAPAAAGSDGLIVTGTFEASGDLQRRPLVLLDPATGRTRPLTHPDWGGRDYSPSFSPDGTKVAFYRIYPCAHDECRNVFVVDTRTLRERQLTHCDSDWDSTVPGHCAEANEVEWLPDGRGMVYQTCRYRAVEQMYLCGIARMNTDGSGVRDVYLPTPVTGGWFQSPTVSPDGSWVAFTHYGEGPLATLDKVRLDGTGHTAVYTDPTHEPGDPRWSPTGNRIAFSLSDSTTGGIDVATVRANGSGLRVLTHTTPGTDWSFLPAWSPNGDRIAYVNASDPAGLQLRVMDADGSGDHQLTQDPATDAFWWQLDWTA